MPIPPIPGVPLPGGAPIGPAHARAPRVSGLFSSVDISASAMSAERLRMTVASENLAHAGDTNRLADGLPYARQRVVFQTVLARQGAGQVDADVVKDPRYAFREDAHHPHADANGIVAEPDIDPILELTDLMVASKSYEANANAARGLLKMHENALRLGQA